MSITGRQGIDTTVKSNLKINGQCNNSRTTYICIFDFSGTENLWSVHDITLNIVVGNQSLRHSHPVG